MSYFITKYALSAGIIEVSEKEFKLVREGSIYGRITKDHYEQGFAECDWAYSMVSAIEQANAKRFAKIASLKKSIAKLEKLDFTKGGVK